MPTLIPDPPPAEVAALLERRRRAGADRHDEVWEGVLHMVPGPSSPHGLVEWQLAALLSPLAGRAGLYASGQFNVGENAHDFRVPDGGLHRGRPTGVWQTTAALVVEIVSPGDETWDKLPFYASHGVDELLIVDPHKRSVDWLALGAGGEYQPLKRSSVIELGADELVGQLDWPPIEDEGPTGEA